MIDIQDLLCRLQGVRASSSRKQSWMARCPAHQDRGPSLSIGIGRNGGILLHCHAGCSCEEIAGALDVRLADLMPDDIDRLTPQGPRPALAPADALRAISLEITIVQMAAARMASGRGVSAEESARVGIAAQRIAETMRLAGVR